MVFVPPTTPNLSILSLHSRTARPFPHLNQRAMRAVDVCSAMAEGLPRRRARLPTPTPAFAPVPRPRSQFPSGRWYTSRHNSGVAARRAQLSYCLPHGDAAVTAPLRVSQGPLRTSKRKLRKPSTSNGRADSCVYCTQYYYRYSCAVGPLPADAEVLDSPPGCSSRTPPMIQLSCRCGMG